MKVQHPTLDGRDRGAATFMLIPEALRRYNFNIGPFLALGRWLVQQREIWKAGRRGMPEVQLDMKPARET